MIGRVLGNRYEIIEKVGSGGMANVYKAKDRMLNRFVAVKVLHSEYKEDEEFIRRFNIESQAAASLSHQNIVQIYDVGDEDGIQYIVMEFLSGRTLKDYIKNKPGGLYWKEAADYSMQICRALEHAHQKHIIHRDIKPQNIVLTPEGILKVTDFGIARASNNNTTKMSSTAIGSAHYLSPEQARGGYTDQRSDIYSLGVVMYELFTGQIPFDAETPVAVAMKHIREEPIPPRKLNSSIPKGIEQIILKAMSKEVRLRYATAEDVLNDLKLLYIDPDAEIESNEPDNGRTRKIDTNEVKRRVDDSAATHSRQEERAETLRGENSRETVRRKKKDNTMVMLTVIIATALVIALLATYAVIRFRHRNEVEIPVPKVTGLSVEDAENMLDTLIGDSKGFTLAVEAYEHNPAEKGTIISQTPNSDATVSSVREIRVVVSEGPDVVTLEDYSKLQFDDVQAQLANKGIIVVKEEESSDVYPAGTIVRQEPEAGNILSTGDSLTLYVSTGSENSIVPKVVGSTEEDARVLIERSGFEVGQVYYTNNKEDKGKVYDQSPDASEKVARGSNIDIYVSTGPAKESDDDGKNSEDETTPSGPNTQQPEPLQIVDDPEQVPEMKTSYLTLYLPDDRSKVTVKLICDGKVIYEKDHNTEAGTAVISLKSRGTINVDIYYDNEFVGTKEVVFQ